MVWGDSAGGNILAGTSSPAVTVIGTSTSSPGTPPVSLVTNRYTMTADNPPIERLLPPFAPGIASTESGGAVVVTGSTNVTSDPIGPGSLVELYAGASCGGTRVPVGVTIPDRLTGNFTISVPLAALNNQRFLSALQTNEEGNTSAFSASCLEVATQVQPQGSYRAVTSTGTVYTFPPQSAHVQTVPNEAAASGQSAAGSALVLNRPVVGMAPTPDGEGYWLVAADGGVFSYGDAAFYGSEGAVPLNESIVGIAATPDGGGYWLVAADGGVFAFGDAGYFGSMGGKAINQPVVGIASSASGDGYLLAASDGGVFAFGDATFHGSEGGTHLNQSVSGIASTPGGGYWLVASDGGVFSFDTAFFGSMGTTHLTAPVVGMASTPDGGGYWLVGADGGIFNFGDARFTGAPNTSAPGVPIVGMTRTYG